MPPQRLPNYLRTYRKRSGLTQRDVAFLLGNSDGAQLSRYEKHHRLPPLETALAFEAIYKVPVAELFAGLYYCAITDVSGRIAKLTLALQEPSSRDSVRMRELRWLTEHHNVPGPQKDPLPWTK